MTVTVITIMADVLGKIPKGLEQRLENLKIRGQVETIQTTALLSWTENTESNPVDVRMLSQTSVRNTGCTSSPRGPSPQVSNLFGGVGFIARRSLKGNADGVRCIF